MMSSDSKVFLQVFGVFEADGAFDIFIKISHLIYLQKRECPNFSPV